MHDMLLTDRHEERATLTVPPTAAPGKTIVDESAARAAITEEAAAATD